MEWIATYENGEKLKESNGNGFYDIERDRVKRFILTNDREKYGFTTKDGILLINGKPLLVYYESDNKIPLCGKTKDLIQFKEAHSDAQMTKDGLKTSGNTIDTHNIGYKRKVESFHFKPIIKRYNEDRIYLQINLSTDTEVDGSIIVEYGDKKDTFFAPFSRPKNGATIPAGKLNYKL